MMHGGLPLGLLTPKTQRMFIASVARGLFSGHGAWSLPFGVPPNLTERWQHSESVSTDCHVASLVSPTIASAAPGMDEMEQQGSRLCAVSAI